MPSVPYMQSSAPFWDFIASLEQQGQGQTHPFFSPPNHNENANAERGEQGPPPQFAPSGWGGWGGRGLPHRGPPGPPPNEERDVDTDGEKEKDFEKENNNDNEKGSGEGPTGSDNEGWGGHRRCGGGRRGEASGSDNEGWGGHRRCGGGRHGEASGSEIEGRCRYGGGRRGRHGGPHGPHAHGGPPGPHGPHGHHGHHGRGGFGGRGRGWGGPWGWGRGGPFGGDAPFNPLAFAAGLFNPEANTTTKNESQDFSPEADIFDTPSAYVIHVSLPGAKKEDVGVNWDAEKSELSIAGVVYRPGDEEFLKTLAMDERKVGPFERKVRLGTRVSPAQIDAEGISARLEDGVLRVEVPKLDTGFVEVRKVDIE
ncbi:HSP20-like chaperone [Melanomma pulvis-pyrius CBS 109.77]|uniref:HSP20-like chaperone n=1 Tax=Melanomma pulvis-pyrius CBS 109.77 TaxID=1314802 RepID=A0A6A6XTU4_9PLEO|nr:HSP20-like chaperone [Melanomma pulvis-pyrius CBS 109.77]